jgi:CheY-like chemotaxis protein
MTLARLEEGPAVDAVLPEPRASARILLVENDEVVRSVAREMLERGGFVVQVASDAATALAVVDQGDVFDVLFVEVLLPDMSGIELARSARRRRHLVGARALFASGSRITAVDLEQHDAFIFKPYGMADLWAAIEDLLG